MSFDMTRREALGVLGAAAGTLLAGPLPAMASDSKDEDSTSDATKGSESGTLYAALPGANSNWGFVDVNGSWVIEPSLGGIASAPGDSCYTVPHVNDSSFARDNQINDNLELHGGVFDGDLFPATTADDTETWGYIDRTGKWAIEPRYLYAACFINGFAVVQDKDEDFHLLRPRVRMPLASSTARRLRRFLRAMRACTAAMVGA